MMMLGVHVASVMFLAATVWFLCRLFAFRASVQHALWLAVLFKLMIPPVVSWPVSPAIRETAWQQLEFRTAQPLASAQHSSPGPVETASNARMQTEPQISPPLFAIPTVLLSVWFLGAAWFVGLFVYRYLRVRRSFGTVHRAAPAVVKIARDAALAMNVRCPEIGLVNSAASPVIVGFTRPRLLIPKWLADTLEHAAWRGVIVHELAHIRRRDHWLGWLEALSLCVWWWNPIAWFVSRRLDETAEMACDAWAVSLSPDIRSAYAETLVRVAACRTDHPYASPVPCMHSGRVSDFRKRLLHLFNANGRHRLPKAAVVAITLFLALVAPGWAQKATVNAPPRIGERAESSAPAVPNTDRTIEFRVYVTSAKVTPDNGHKHVKRPHEPKAYDRLSMQLRSVGAGVSTGLIEAGNTTLTVGAEGPSWNDEVIPTKGDVAFVAAPRCPLKRGTAVELTFPLTGEFDPFLRVKSAPGLGLSYEPRGPEEVEFWAYLTLPTEDNTVSTATFDGIWTKNRSRVFPDEWNCFTYDVTQTEQKTVMTWFVFFREAAPAPTTKPPTNQGRFFCSTLKGRYPESGELPAEYSAEVLFLEGPSRDVRAAIEGFNRVAFDGPSEGIEAFTVPRLDISADLQIITDETAHDALFRKLSGFKSIELVSAPRVTFTIDSPRPKLVMRDTGKGSTSKDGFTLEGFLREWNMASFWEQEKPQAVISDSTGIEISPGNERQYGILAAVAARGTEDPQRFNLTLGVNYRSLQTKPRGWAFWKKAEPPEILEAPSTLRFAYQLEDRIVFLKPSPHPDRLMLLEFTMAKAPNGGARFLEAGS